MDINEFTKPLGEFEEIELQNRWCYAFRPSKLPLDFKIDLDLLNRMSSLMSILSKLKSALDTNETLIPKISPALISKAVLTADATRSQNIENIDVTLNDVYLYGILDDSEFLSVTTGKTKLNDVRETIIYMDTMKHLLSSELSIGSIKKAHFLFMKNSLNSNEKRPGEFRNHDVWIGKRDESVDHARFVPTRHIHIDDLMENLFNYLVNDKKTPLLIKAAISHYQFETIHPFSDGNGRIGRMLMQKLISDEFFDSKMQINLASFFQKNKQEYKDTLLRVSQTSNINFWIDFFLEAMFSQISESASLISNLIEIKKEWLKVLDSKGLRFSKNVTKVIDGILSVPYFTWNSLKEESGVEYQTVRNITKKLIDAGIVTQLDSKKTNVFCALDVIRLFES
ncbi:MAG: Fic family protein [Caldisericia bacterium]